MCSNIQRPSSAPPMMYFQHFCFQTHEQMNLAPAPFYNQSVDWETLYTQPRDPPRGIKRCAPDPLESQPKRRHLKSYCWVADEFEVTEDHEPDRLSAFSTDSQGGYDADIEMMTKNISVLRIRNCYDYATQDLAEPRSPREAGQVIVTLKKDGSVTKPRAHSDTTMQDKFETNIHKEDDRMIILHTKFGPVTKVRAREHFSIRRMNLPQAVLDALDDDATWNLERVFSRDVLQAKVLFRQWGVRQRYLAKKLTARARKAFPDRFLGRCNGQDLL